MNTASPSRRRIALFAIAILGIVLVAVLSAWLCKGRLAPSGGLLFPWRVELAVPPFRQAAEQWRNDRLGWSRGTLGAEGCAIASTAMVLKSYGIDTDPQRLNWYLSANGGYTDQGWLYWERAADLAPDRVRHVYEDDASYFLIDWNLLRGNPVIVRLRLSSGITHFVVIAGKQDFDYLIRDPGNGAEKGIYPLKEIGSDIEALRYYERLN
jgi:hypothetical protein